MPEVTGCSAAKPRNTGIAGVRLKYIAIFFALSIIFGIISCSMNIVTAKETKRIISGTVVDQNDKPVPDAEVYTVFLHDKPKKSHFSKSDTTGRFRIDITDQFTPENLRFSDGIGVTVYAKSLNGEMLASRHCAVYTYGDTEELKLKLSQIIPVRAKVLDEQGQPISGARFCVVPLWSNHLEEVQSDDEGNVEYTLTQTSFAVNEFELQYLYFCVYKEGYGFATLPLKEFKKNEQNPKPLEFQLLPGKSVRFRVLDPQGKPMPNAEVGFNHVAKPDAFQIYLQIKGKTDAQGEYEFNMIPQNADVVFHFYVNCPDGISVLQNPIYNPYSKMEKDGPMEVKTVAPVLLSGTIRDEQGNPLPDTHLNIVSRNYREGKPHFFRYTKTDADGKYSIPVYPDYAYLHPDIVGVPVTHGIFLSDPRVIFPGKPIDDFDFTAQKLYKVSGEVAISDKVLKSMEVQQHKYIDFKFIDQDTDPNKVYEQITAVDSTGEEITYSNHKFKGNTYVEAGKENSAKYVIYLPEGKFKVISNNNQIEEATVTVTGGESETVFNLTAKPLQTTMDGSKRLYTGRVVRKNADDELVPVVGAIVEEESSMGMTPSETKTKTDANGEFTFLASNDSNQPSFFVRTEDFSEVGYAKAVKPSEEMEIELFPAASLKMRLTDPKTKNAVTNSKVMCIGPVRMGEGMVFPPYFRDLRSDAKGNIAMKGFIPRVMYQIQCIPPNSDSPEETSAMVGMFIALEPGEFDAGDVNIVDVRSPREMIQYVFAPFREQASAKQRYVKSCNNSKDSKKPVLVFFAHAGTSEDHLAFMNWVMTVVFGIQGQKYLAAYEYVPVDLSKESPESTKPQELAKLLGVTLPDESEFLICVTDSEGKLLTQRNSKSFYAPLFKPDGNLKNEFDPVLLLTFLREFGKNER